MKSQGEYEIEIKELFILFQKEGMQRLAELQNDQAALKDTLASVGSDAYIENQARTVYGYMMPDEIRLVISNPETLYGEEGVPSR